MRLALFDLDHTLLPIDSDHAFGEFLIQLGWADAASYRQRNLAFYEQYQAERLDIHEYVAFCTEPLRGKSLPQLADAQARFMAEWVTPQVREPALALVRKHALAGDLMAVVTATNDFITAPIAAAFGVPHLIATTLARDLQGLPNGKIEGTPSFREGKVRRVQQWLRAQGLGRDDFDSITFYSDSANDLALLQWATHPVAVNPGAGLEREALQRGWPILRLFET